MFTPPPSPTPERTRDEVSPSPSSTKSPKKGPKKSLENFDPKTISLKELKEKSRSKTGRGPLTSAAFALFDSPRTLQALAEEGVDPMEQLAQRNLSDFLLMSKGDVACAEVRLKHYESQRDQILESLRKRRERIIERQQGSHPRRREYTAEEGSLQRPIRTPTVVPTEELTGTAPPPQDEESHGRCRSLSLSQSQSLETTSREPSEQRRGTAVISDPEEYRRQAAAEKKAKVLRQAQKMREVMEANAKRERQKQETLAKLSRLREEREAEVQKRRRRVEVEQRMREAAALKREAELNIQREKREQVLGEKQEELDEARVVKMQEFEEKEQARREEEERELELMNVRRAKKRRKVALRRLAIKEHSDRLLEEQKGRMVSRMSRADEVREELNLAKTKEIEQRQHENQVKTEENRKKRERADEQFVKKITRYKEKAAVAEEHRQEMKREKDNYFLFRTLQEKEKTKERKALTAKVRADEEKYCEDLLTNLHAAEEHCREVQAEKLKESRLRGAEKELVVEDRRIRVHRMQRMIEHGVLEAEAKYDAKMARIKALEHDAEEADKNRRLIQYKALQQAQKLAERNKAAAALYAAPGPLEYNAVDAERFLHGHGTAVRFGHAAYQRKRVDLSPGPGAYGRPLLPRRIKGGVMPPKEDLGVDALMRLSQDKKKKAQSEKRAKSSLDKRSQQKLPKIGEHHIRSESAPLKEKSGQEDALAAPEELSEEDFHSSDEFDSVSESSDQE